MSQRLSSWLCGALCVFLPACSGLDSCPPLDHRIHQVYYLGAFDPMGQLPPTVYRLRVRGWAPPISTVNYAAGWVPADFVDSLGTSIGLEDGQLTFERKDGSVGKAALETGRRMMLFGPEGFRAAPADHRLAVVMASDPSAFFEAIDSALGQLSAAKALEATTAPAIEAKITQALLASTREKAELDAFRVTLPQEEE